MGNKRKAPREDDDEGRADPDRMDEDPKHGHHESPAAPHSEVSDDSDDEVINNLVAHFLESNTEDITADELFQGTGDFEVFDPQPQDFQGIKLLLRQLFNADSDLFDLSALTDLILSQPTIGSTIKMTPEEDTPTHLEDPVSVLTVLNLNEHRSRPEVKAVSSYLAAKALANRPLLAQNISHLLCERSKAQVGLVVCERIGVPSSMIIPEIYRMLLEEIGWAVDDNEPYRFSHYLIVSKQELKVPSKLDGTIVMDEDDDDEDDGTDSDRRVRPAKKSKKSRKRFSKQQLLPDIEPRGESHDEMELFRTHSMGEGGFEYSNTVFDGSSDAKRTLTDLGSIYKGHMMLLEAKQFVSAVKAMPAYFEKLGGEQQLRSVKARERFDRLVEKRMKETKGANGRGKGKKAKVKSGG